MSKTTDIPARPPMRFPAPALRQHGIALALIAASLMFYTATALVTGQYAQLTFAGFMGLFERTVALSLVAIGQTVVIASGAIDLSVANLVSVAAVLTAYFMQNDPGNIAQAVAIVLIVSAAVGVGNGVLVALLGVNPLIATLGTSLVLQGILTVAYGGLQGAVPKVFQVVAYGTVGAMPVSVLGLLIVAALTAFALNYTRVGSRLFAVGGNARAARLAGIHGGNVTIAAFAF